MQYLLVEVKSFQIHLFLQPAWSYTILLRPSLIQTMDAHLFCFECRFVRLQDNIIRRVIRRLNIEYPEIIVIRSCHYVPTGESYFSF